MPLENYLVDGFSGNPGDQSGSDEVTLDIDLQIAMAPQAAKVIVYEGYNDFFGALDVYQAIADDDRAQQISTSWGLPETAMGYYGALLESLIFQQMAAQGQTIYAAAGDNGAFDDGYFLCVDDPASQPYITGVGGTMLTTNGPGGSAFNETNWNDLPFGYWRAGGGGVSIFWTKPGYQGGFGFSPTARNVPDVSLNSAPFTGYDIYYTDPSGYNNPGWYTFGGTSCASPLWAGFTALVNQQRAAHGLSGLGFANPWLYRIGKGPNGNTDFNDIEDGSTNMYYSALKGYDNATGWGTLNGTSLLLDMAAGTLPPGFDVNGDGYEDILWRNQSNGDAVYWLLNGATYAGGGYLSTVSTDWQIVGTPDINQDGHPDILWRNINTGDTAYWLMDGSNYLGGDYLFNVSPDWQIVGTPDINNDGHPDILWCNQYTGDTAYWTLGTLGNSDGNVYSGGGYLFNVSPDWQIVGTPDINQDGHPDILWRNSNTGNTAYWTLGTSGNSDGNAYSGGGFLFNVPPDWQIVGTPDLNADGHPDILWRNVNSGALSYWTLGTAGNSDGTIQSGGGFIANVPSGFTVSGS